MCLASGWRWLSPAELWNSVTFEEWLGICRYSNQEPWGELRQDLRMSSVVANLLGAFAKHKADTPNLIWPYVETAEDIADEANKVLEHAKRLMLDGSLARQHGNSPGT